VHKIMFVFISFLWTSKDIIWKFLRYQLFHPHGIIIGVDTDWSVNVCNGYVREYCEAFCEKKKPLYEERDKANSKDAKKAAKKALKAEKNAKIATEIRAEKINKEAILPTTTPPDPALDPEYDPEATTTIPEDDNSEAELGQLGGPAVEPPDTNAKTFAEMQIDHLRDKTFAKEPGEDSEDLSEFEIHDVLFKMMLDSSVTEEQADQFCEKVSAASGLPLSICSLAGEDPELLIRIEESEGNQLMIKLGAEGKAAAAAAAENMESTLTSAAAEAGIPVPTKMKSNFASEGELSAALDADDTNSAALDTNDTNSAALEGELSPDTNDIDDTNDTNSAALDADETNTSENALPGSDGEAVGSEPGTIDKYKSLNGLAENQGTELDKSDNKSLEEAKKACDDKENCESFGFCTNKGEYYLFDKKITNDSEALKGESYDCKTYFRSYEARDWKDSNKEIKPKPRKSQLKQRTQRPQKPKPRKSQLKQRTQRPQLMKHRTKPLRRLWKKARKHRRTQTLKRRRKNSVR